jgi:hypothetical protein
VPCGQLTPLPPWFASAALREIPASAAAFVERPAARTDDGLGLGEREPPGSLAGRADLARVAVRRYVGEWRGEPAFDDAAFGGEVRVFGLRHGRFPSAALLPSKYIPLAADQLRRSVRNFVIFDDLAFDDLGFGLGMRAAAGEPGVGSGGSELRDPGFAFGFGNFDSRRDAENRVQNAAALRVIGPARSARPMRLRMGRVRVRFFSYLLWHRFRIRFRIRSGMRLSMRFRMRFRMSPTGASGAAGAGRSFGRVGSVRLSDLPIMDGEAAVGRIDEAAIERQPATRPSA